MLPQMLRASPDTNPKTPSETGSSIPRGPGELFFFAVFASPWRSLRLKALLCGGKALNRKVRKGCCKDHKEKLHGEQIEDSEGTHLEANRELNRNGELRT
jgi:hypothetical protein